VLPGGRRERVGLLGRWRSLVRGQLGPLGRAAERAHEALEVAVPGDYLLLNHSLARRIVKAHSDWLDEVERELAN
jgi:hypothetical protein